MSILYITNITDAPYDMIGEKISDAIRKIEETTGRTVTEEEKAKCWDEIERMVEDFEKSGNGDALAFVDNLLVNHDYLETVKNVLA
jgi:hypothetical protein